MRSISALLSRVRRSRPTPAAVCDVLSGEYFAIPEPDEAPCTHRSGRHRALWHSGIAVEMKGIVDAALTITRTYCVRCLWCGQERPESEARPRDRRDEW